MKELLDLLTKEELINLILDSDLDYETVSRYINNNILR